MLYSDIVILVENIFVCKKDRVNILSICSWFSRTTILEYSVLARYQKYHSQINYALFRGKGRWFLLTDRSSILRLLFFFFCLCRARRARNDFAVIQFRGKIRERGREENEYRYDTRVPSRFPLRAHGSLFFLDVRPALLEVGGPIPTVAATAVCATAAPRHRAPLLLP
jgi:hypothetical protein